MSTNRFHIVYARSRGVHHPALRTLFAAGLGIVFGFQNWRLAEYGFSLSLPWYGSALIMFTGFLLGLAIAATASQQQQRLRGVLLGLIISLPTAFGAIRLGLGWFPHGIAAVVAGMIAGFLIALVTDAVFP